MTHLTNDMREGIVRRAIDASFSAEQAVLVEQEHVLAMQFYELVFSEDIRRAASAMPEGWLRVDRCLRFRLGYRRIVLNCNPGVRVPSNAYNCSELGGIDDGDAVDAFEALERTKNDLSARIKNAAREIHGLLASARTVKRLRAAWPEGAAFYSRYEEARPGLPTPTAAHINALLGLPAAETAVQP